MVQYSLVYVVGMIVGLLRSLPNVRMLIRVDIQLETHDIQWCSVEGFHEKNFGC